MRLESRLHPPPAPGILRHLDAPVAAHELAKRVGQRSALARTLGQKLPGAFGERQKLPSARLGQQLQHGQNLLREQSRHQPLEALGRHPRQQRDRHFQGNAVVVAARLEVVDEVDGLLLEQQLVREIPFRTVRKPASLEALGIHEQVLRMLAFGAPAPGFETLAVTNVLRDQIHIEGVHIVVRHQHIGASQLVLVAAQLVHQHGVLSQKFGRRRQHPVHDRRLDEDGVGVLAADGGESHPASRRHRQTVQAGLLVNHDLARLRIPVGVEVAAPQQIAAGALDPLGANARHLVGVQTAGFHQLRSHHPARLANRLTGAGREVKFRAVRTRVAALGVAQADIA